MPKDGGTPALPGHNIALEGTTLAGSRKKGDTVVHRQQRRARALLRLERRRLGRFGAQQKRRLARAVVASRELASRVVVASRDLARRAARLGVRGGKIGVALVIVSLVLGGTTFAGTRLYDAFGPGRQPASRIAWADRAPRYGAATCTDCHAPESTAALASAHAVVNCELCHTPTVAHPGGVPSVVAALPASTSATCIACHGAVGGRPQELPQVELAAHYPLVDCLRCHDPHTAAAVTPPPVAHPLANLPECTTCHSPIGLKRYPQGHQPSVDSVCLACHRPQASQ